MQNLLRTILTELENHKLMFRANAYELWNYGCENMIVDWGYDQDALIKTLKEFEFEARGGNILIQHEDNYLKHKDLIARLKKDFLEEVKEGDHLIGMSFENDNSTMNQDNPVDWINSLSDDEIIKEFPKFYYCGDEVIMWELYNDGIECLSDYTTGLDKYFDMSKLYQDWDDEFAKFIKGLS